MTLMKRYANDKELGPRSHIRSALFKRYLAPMLVVHRGDLQHVLHEAANNQDVDIRTKARVVNIDRNFEARVQLSSGEWVEGDLLIGADGIHSRVRTQIASHLGAKDQITPTGHSAYRVTIPRDKLAQEPEILSHLDLGISTRWMGPRGHIMAYPVRKNRLYNMVFLHPTKPGKIDETNLWSQKGDKQEMTSFYGSWSPTVQRLISYVPASDLMEWPLNLRPPLPRWAVNKTALLGDACHPMLPYVAQGAAQAIEDVGVLAVCLSMTSDVALALKVYEAVRKTRAEKIQDSAMVTAKALHLPDGPEQEERDRRITEAGGKSPDLWADREFQDFMWGVDIMRETQERWEILKGAVL